VEGEPFMLTYGDGVCDVDLGELLAFHRAQGRVLSMTVVQPEGRYGAVEFGPGPIVSRFVEKPPGDGVWINGGYFVCEPGIFDYLRRGDATTLEREPLELLVQDGQLAAYRHQGFWKAMDTLRDKMQLNSLWDSGSPPWKVWS
jgi:glucose-1-phosphate cytidylyltransferase